ncbi:hypothetical protein [Mitsuaria sp. GD03876]|uniref:pilus assembly PilX family protein n=1 Tax=Mitsuaria sp. GD03876 TaxID=2975399 RepID=UPI00244C2FB3|nr:hypothetical protein [Mitsuaria sp. GD03876]MDH0864215.1 hypothetical protein [Mitsuaria sp. GD03876]
MRPLPPPSRAARAARRQRGVIMVIALVTLAILLIGAAATMRSMSVSMLNSGNFGFKRDMTNQAERAVRAAFTSLTTGGLADPLNRQVSSPTLNYSATLLPSDASGIPLAMLNLNDIDGLNGLGVGGNAIKDQADGIELHYLIDRLCTTGGTYTVNNCQVLGRSDNSGYNPRNPKVVPQPTYRITVRVRGPHDSYAFYQTTYTSTN